MKKLQVSVINFKFVNKFEESGAKIPVDQVNSAIQMKDLVEQTESNLKAGKQK